MSKADEAKNTIKIENVVANTAIGQDIDLKYLTLLIFFLCYYSGRAASRQVAAWSDVA